MKHERSFPTGFSEVKDGDAVVYFGQLNGRWVAKGYCGKRNKADFFNSYTSREHMDKVIAGYFENRKASLKHKAFIRDEQKKRAQELKAFMKPGQIYYNSWGYDQTNVDFYQVVDVKGSNVILREIKATLKDAPGYSPMSGFSEPVANAFVSGPIVKRITCGGISFEHGGCSLYKGEPVYTSWYA